MRSRFHLFICDEGLERVWCSDSPQGWVCPVISTAWNVRGTSAIRLHGARLGLSSRVRRLGYALMTHPEAPVEWAAILVGAAEYGTKSRLTPRQFSELNRLECAVPVQKELARALFEDRDTLRRDTCQDLVEWSAGCLGIPPSAISSTQLRASACADVVEIRTESRRLFGKWTVEDHFREAELTMALSRLGAAVQTTIAYDSRRRFWLTAAANGRLLQKTGRTEDVDRAAAALGRQEAICARVARASVQTPCVALTRARTLSAIESLCRLATPWISKSASLPARLERILSDLPLDEPFAILHTDPAPSNILVDDDGTVTFIDWAEACSGPPGLAIELFIERLRQFTPRWLPSTSIDSQRIRDVYEANGGTVLSLSPWERVLLRAVVRAALDFEVATCRRARRELLSAYEMNCASLLARVVAAMDLVTARAVM